MCGIVGIVDVQASALSKERLKKMADSIAHRGPDGEGYWISEEGNCGLAHRRLSIIDLSDAGNQPMHYMDRYVIVFNGEIYNYIELKRSLEQKGYCFANHTDTEVLTALYHEKQQALLDDVDGMFAFAIYDRQTKKLFAARDRFGEKPFFYTYSKGRQFIFGSEMKVLWAAGLSRTINERMLYNYLANELVENPEDQTETFFSECSRLQAGHYLMLDTTTCVVTSIKRYWDIDRATSHSDIEVDRALHIFRDLFATSVKRRLRSDVPVGSSLSGGLDSSLVVCQIADINRDENKSTQKTFSARFKDHYKDEGKYMKMVIDRTRVDSYFTYPSDEAFINDLNKLVYHHEEPFRSSSIYAQYKVMELAKENNVTVLLDGQGADEILAGYHSYFMVFFDGLKSSDSQLYRKEFDAYKHLHRTNTINGVLKKDLKYIIKSNLPQAVNDIKRLHQYYQQRTSPFFSKEFFATFSNNTFMPRRKFEGLNDVLYHSTLNNGLHELLRYADRNSMAHSREVRLPFLFHELVEFCFSLPPTFKIHNGWTKWIMRQSCQDLLPEEIAWRKDKIGFETPEASWLKQEKIQELICDSTQTLVHRKVLHPNLLKKKSAAGNNESIPKSWQRLMAASLFFNT